MTATALEPDAIGPDGKPILPPNCLCGNPAPCPDHQRHLIAGEQLALLEPEPEPRCNTMRDRWWL